MKKINYRVADAVFLIIVFVGLKVFDKYMYSLRISVTK